MCFGNVSQTTASSDRSSRSGRSSVTGTRAVARNIAADVSMGAATFGRSREAGSARLREQGYSQAAVDDYYTRTAATQERARQAEAQAAAMREQGRSSEQPQRPTSTINTGGAATPAPTPAPTPTPVVPAAPPPVGETPETFVPGPTETAVVEEAKKKTGYAGTIETTPSGLMTEAKTRKKRSLMGGLLSA